MSRRPPTRSQLSGGQSFLLIAGVVLLLGAIILRVILAHDTLANTIAFILTGVGIVLAFFKVILDFPRIWPLLRSFGLTNIIASVAIVLGIFLFVLPFILNHRLIDDGHPTPTPSLTSIPSTYPPPGWQPIIDDPMKTNNIG